MRTTQSNLSAPIKRKSKKQLEIGWSELVDLPELGIVGIHAKIDTGAATSSLHAVKIKTFEREGENWLSFVVPKSPDHPAFECEAKMIALRTVKSSNGTKQNRYVIETFMQMGPISWTGQMTLANRQSMAYPVLIGRRSLRRRFLVNSGKRWMLGK